MSETEGVGQQCGGGEGRMRAEDYGDDSPYYEVYEDQDGDYSEGGEGEEPKLMREVEGEVVEALWSRNGMEAHFEVGGKEDSVEVSGRRGIYSPRARRFA